MELRHSMGSDQTADHVRRQLWLGAIFETDEPGQPGVTHIDAGEYDERSETSHKGGVKIP